LEAEIVVKHKHKWTFMGICLGGHRNGMAHRTCGCGAELYQPTTKKERTRHDPTNEVSRSAVTFRNSVERVRDAALLQASTLKNFYEWFKDAGSWASLKGNPKGCQWTLTPAEAHEGGQLSDAVDTALKQGGKLADAELRLQAMQAVVDAAVTWNDEVPALSQVEAKLVSAVVSYRQLVEKEITV
jgi:hypothetical protein